MFAHFGANCAAVHSVACNVCRRKANIAARLALLAVSGIISGCAVPVASSGQDPANPAAKVAAVGYRPVIAPYTSLRPSTPAPWRERNENVAPNSRQEPQ